MDERELLFCGGTWRKKKLFSITRGADGGKNNVTLDNTI